MITSLSTGTRYEVVPGPSGSVSARQACSCRWLWQARRVSDDFLCLIPAGPWWLPGGDMDAQAIAAGRLIVPGADKVVVKRHAEPVFCDAGENFERVLCPGCGREVPIDWWRERMLAAWETGAGRWR
jgi:hypothetical protein